MLGKTIPKTRRGRVNGISAGVAGLATLGAGAGLVAVGADDGERTTFFVLRAGAAVLWGVAAGVYSRIVEWPGESESGTETLAWQPFVNPGR